MAQENQFQLTTNEVVEARIQAWMAAQEKLMRDRRPAEHAQALAAARRAEAGRSTVLLSEGSK